MSIGLRAEFVVDAPGHPQLRMTRAGTQVFREFQNATWTQAGGAPEGLIEHAREKLLDSLCQSFLMYRAFSEYDLSWPEVWWIGECDPSEQFWIGKPTRRLGRSFKALCCSGKYRIARARP